MRRNSICGNSAQRAAAIAVTIACSAAAQTPTAIFQFDGTPGDQLGSAVACAGDVDSDGVPDFIVGQPGARPAGFASGTATVWSGATGTVLYQFEGRAARDQLGRSVSGAGDVNADGYADVIVGAPTADVGGQDTGTVYVFSGRDGSILHRFDGQSQNAQFASAVAGGGDVDGDGFDDILVGARSESCVGSVDCGSVRVYSGRNGSILWTRFGITPHSRLGTSVAIAGDVDGDGLRDVVVGAPGSSVANISMGAAFVYAGRSGVQIHRFDGLNRFDRFGVSVASAGDVDFDGFDDILAASSAHNSQFGAKAGEARIFSGYDGSVLIAIVGQEVGASLGSTVAGLGDVDGDGVPDFALGARYASNSLGLRSGAAFAYSGATGLCLCHTFGVLDDSQFGAAVASAGDLNSDGKNELLIGAPSDHLPGNQAGSAVVMDFRFANPAGRLRSYGVGCPGTAGHIARMDFGGTPRLGRSFWVRIRGARPLSTAILHLGPAGVRRLDGIGMVGCRLYVDPALAHPAITATNGTLRALIYVPLDPTLRDLTFDLQWAIADPGAPHSIPATVSDAVRVVVGG